MTTECNFLPLTDIYSLAQVLDEVNASNLKEPRAYKVSSFYIQVRLKEKVKGKPVLKLKKGLASTLKTLRLLLKLFPEFESFVYTIAPFTDDTQPIVIKNNVELLQNDYKRTFGNMEKSPLYDRVLTYWEPIPDIKMPVPLLNKVLPQITAASDSSCLLTTWFNFGHTAKPLVNFSSISQNVDDTQLSFYSDRSRAKIDNSTFGDISLPVFTKEKVDHEWEKCWLLLRLHVQQVLQQPEETEDPENTLLQKEGDSGSEGYVSAEEGKAAERKDEEGAEEKKTEHQSPTLAEEVPRRSLRRTAARVRREEEAAAGPRPSIGKKLTKAEKDALAAARTEAKALEEEKKQQEQVLTKKYKKLLQKKRIYFDHKDVRTRNVNLPYNWNQFIKVALITPKFNHDIVYEFRFSKSLVTVLKSLVVTGKPKIYIVWIHNDGDTTKHLRNFVTKTEQKFDHIVFHQLKDNDQNPIVKDFLGNEENVTALNETLSDEGSIIFHSKTRQSWKSLADTVTINNMLPLNSPAFTETFQYYFFYLDLHAYYKKSFIESQIKAQNLDLFFPAKKKQSKNTEYALGNLQTVYMLFYNGSSFDCAEVDALEFGNKFVNNYYPLNFVAEESYCDDLKNEIVKNWDIDKKIFNVLKKTDELPFVSKYIQQGKSSLFLSINELLLLKNDFNKLIDYNLLFGKEAGTLPWYLGNHALIDVEIDSLKRNYDENIVVSYKEWCFLLVFFYQTITLVVLDINEQKLNVFQVKDKEDVNVFYILTVESEYYPLFPVFDVEDVKSKDMISDVANLFSLDLEEPIVVPKSQYIEE